MAVAGYAVLDGKTVNSQRHGLEDEATDTASETDTENDSDAAEDTDVPIGLPIVAEKSVDRPKSRVRQFFWSILEASGIILTITPLMFLSVIYDGSMEREMNQIVEGTNGIIEGIVMIIISPILLFVFVLIQSIIRTVVVGATVLTARVVYLFAKGTCPGSFKVVPAVSWRIVGAGYGTLFSMLAFLVYFGEELGITPICGPSRGSRLAPRS